MEEDEVETSTEDEQTNDDTSSEETPDIAAATAELVNQIAAITAERDALISENGVLRGQLAEAQNANYNLLKSGGETTIEDIIDDEIPGGIDSLFEED